jgi:hypothetical protein
MEQSKNRFFSIKDSKENRKVLEAKQFNKLQSAIFNNADKKVLIIDSTYKSFWSTCVNVGLEESKNLVKEAHSQKIKPLKSIQNV